MRQPWCRLEEQAQGQSVGGCARARQHGAEPWRSLRHIFQGGGRHAAARGAWLAHVPAGVGRVGDGPQPRKPAPHYLTTPRHARGGQCLLRYDAGGVVAPV